VTAPVGATVRIYVDLVARVAPGDVIETTSGRRYQVLGVRVQERGERAGRRQHLSAIVLAPDDMPIVECTNRDAAGFICSSAEHGCDDCCEHFNRTGGHSPVVHRIRWYPRSGGKRRHDRRRAGRRCAG